MNTDWDRTPHSLPEPGLVRDVALARGDGIGPEICDAVRYVLEAARAPLAFHDLHIGDCLVRSGSSSGIDEAAWRAIQRHRILLKGPMTTPQGGGYKSINVTLRKALGLCVNLRPVQSLAPLVPGAPAHLDVVVVRENEEDTYGGIEHQQTPEVAQCLKLITRPGSERVIRYAFEYAAANGRHKVTCLTKDNIMKLTDGLFHKVFDEIAAEYPTIQAEHLIIDIGTARLATHPQHFDVIVTPNLYGDILSDVAAELSGSVGLAGSANLGSDFAMFEAVHGSAPQIANRNVANPSGLLMAALMLLDHVGAGEVAHLIHNAWLCTLEDGIHTIDLFNEATSRRRVGTREFAAAVVERLGRQPNRVPPAKRGRAVAVPRPERRARPQKLFDGVDVFLDWDAGQRNPRLLGWQLTLIADPFRLKMITNRGVKVYPDGLNATFCTDHWRCRFLAPADAGASARDVATLLARLAEVGFDVVKTENLYRLNGQRAYSLGQGE